jgi:KAP-like P-loop domain-containing protein
MYSKIILDNPSAHPGLKFEDYANAFKNIIELSDPQFCIGIFGGWGTGKTTLMRAIKERLDDKIVSVWFNAWRYEKEEHLIIPLLDTLRDALVTWADSTENGRTVDSSLRERAIKAAATVSKAAKAILAGMTIKAKFPLIEFDFESDKALKSLAEGQQGNTEADKDYANSPQSVYHTSFKALRDSLTEFTQYGDRGQRIVVFIDDLDRCFPANALQVLESMKLFFDFEGCVFVVALDRKVIEASVNWKYSLTGPSEASSAALPVDGANYIKKLFQVPYNLPSISSAQLDDYLEAISSSAKEGREERAELLARVRPHLDALVGDSEVNPREVKRFINSYIIQKLIRPHLDDDVTLVLQTIEFRSDWNQAYEVYRSMPDAFAQAAKRQLDGENEALKDLDPRLGQLPGSFFDYIRTKGGQKLVNLAPAQAAEQVRSFEATRTEGSGPGAILNETLNDLSMIRIDLDRIDFTQNFDSAVGIIENFRRAIERIHNRLSGKEIAAEFRSSGASEKELMSRIVEEFSSLKDGCDSLIFALRRGAGMGQTEFDDLLKKKSALVKDIQRVIATGGEIARLIDRRNVNSGA